MKQTRSMSFLEAFVNTVSGYVVSIIVTYYGLPWFGFEPTFIESNFITIIFTIVSLFRIYIIRRLFNEKVEKLL